MSKQIHSTLIPRLFRSRNILLDILARQGYKTEDYKEFSINEIANMEKNKQLDMLMERDDGRKVYVKYHLTTKLRPNHIYEFTDDLFNLEKLIEKTDDFIIIAKDPPNDTLTKLMTTLYNTDNIYFNIFGINKLLFNALDHKLVPPHRVIADSEVETLMNEKQITQLSEFPEIDRFDIVATLIGLRPGQICEIIRSSKTSISTKYYRLCY